jgi:NosR/NirI family nitrous oxide reductase transcriptional regulator
MSFSLVSDRRFIFMKEIRKIIATALVAVVFLYFWINGPLMQSIEVLSLETIETKYSAPVMVGKDGVDKKGELTSFHTLEFEEEEAFGHGLIIEKKTPNNNWGFIADVKNNPGLSEELAADILEHAKQFSNKAHQVEVHPSMEMYYSTISDTNSHNTSIYLESTQIIKNIRGYSGEINVGVIIGEDGFIKQVEHISSKETQSYLSDIKNSGYYDQFKNISITKGSQQIDAISGATLTSEAIASTVSTLIEESIPYPVSNYADIDEVNFFSLSAMLTNSWIIHVIVIFLMFVFAIQKWIKKSKRSIIVLSILSVVYIGFFLNNSFTYISFIHPFLGTSVSSLMGLYSLMVLLGAIWGKNTYCKYVCPFGNIQRLIIQVNPIKTSRKFFLSSKWIKRVRAALTVILLAGILLGLRNWSNYELFPDLFGLSILSVWFVVAVITVLTTMVYPMIWCRLLCPTGSVLDGISDLINYKRKHR